MSNVKKKRYDIALNLIDEKDWVRFKESDNMLRVSTCDQCWRHEDIKVLKEHNIIYDRGCFAIYVLELDTDNPQIVIGTEDDGCITFDLTRKVSAINNDDLRCVATAAQRLIERKAKHHD